MMSSGAQRTSSKTGRRQLPPLVRPLLPGVHGLMPTCADVTERSRHLDDHFSRRPPGLGIRERLTHVLERKYLVHQRFDSAAFHEPRDFSQLFSVGSHEQVLVAGVLTPRGSGRLAASHFHTLDVAWAES